MSKKKIHATIDKTRPTISKVFLADLKRYGDTGGHFSGEKIVL
jgi:hypothetical protein